MALRAVCTSHRRIAFGALASSRYSKICVCLASAGRPAERLIGGRFSARLPASVSRPQDAHSSAGGFQPPAVPGYTRTFGALASAGRPFICRGFSTPGIARIFGAGAAR